MNLGKYCILYKIFKHTVRWQEVRGSSLVIRTVGREAGYVDSGECLCRQYRTISTEEMAIGIPLILVVRMLPEEVTEKGIELKSLPS